ncbi:MAG: PEGA domain-containing protein [Alphaproteobacteria bacterium]|nr:PEGA domain-containing protein [Alphaproteobacteria bacterium]
MKCFAVFCLGVLTSYGAIAAGCDWATETPPDDAKYKYFVARVYSDTSAADAQAKAERDIDAQLGRLFGVKLNMQSEFYSDTTSADGTTRSYERTIGAITLKGLERQKSDTQKTSGAWVGCVQYRYPKAEITREKERLAKLGDAEKEQPLTFTEVQGDTQCKGAPVEIVTTPGGAYVTLDNGKYQGTSPIKFGNVCNGKHSLEITKENYTPVTQQVIVPTSGRISKTLKRDSKRITVRTSLKNSQIEINGVNKGKEPVVFNAPLGLEQTITATNSEAVKITRTRTFSKDSDSEYIIGMEKLPGRLDFSAFKVRNPDVRITVDGKEIKGNTTGELSPDKSHRLNFSKKGFYEINKSLSISGGETTYYPSSELHFSKEPSETIGIFGGIGASTGINNTGFNLDLGLDYKTKYFYGSLAGQLNYIFLPKSTVSTDFYKAHYSVDIDLSYAEFLYSQLGVNISQRWTLFGIGSLGQLRLTMSDSMYVNGFNVLENTKTMVRFGGGIQYSISKKDSAYGLRIFYLTGQTNLSIDDIKFNVDDSHLKNKTFEKDYPKQINSFNITFFFRSFFAPGGKHADN